ncbi:MAG: hypothetical protein ACQEUZ_01860 [Pseudomonadota bacterium]
MSGEDEVSREITEIQEVMRDDAPTYWRDEGMQGRYRELLDAQERGPGAPAKAGGAQAERAEIERIMRREPRRYWKDPAMQARYREILAAEEASTPEASASEEPKAGELVPMPRLSEWRQEGNDPAHFNAYAALVRSANDVLVAAGEAASEIDAGLVKLPQPVQVAALHALTDRNPVPSDPLSEEQMREVLSLPSNAALSREWGHEAPRKFGKVEEKLWRIVDRLSDPDARKAIRWLDGLSGNARTAIYRKLAA